MSTERIPQPDTESADARYLRRRKDPDAHAVAVESAARAYASAHGWDWPSLEGLSTTGNVELARIEYRQHIRFWARIMVDEYERSLTQGRETADELARQVAAIRDQRAKDAKRRMELKPKPATVLEMRAASQERG